tara:strand:- start:940 stop:1239 length:300 start_codon:yes stop_codon:yes gene_type:complete
LVFWIVIGLYVALDGTTNVHSETAACTLAHPQRRSASRPFGTLVEFWCTDTYGPEPTSIILANAAQQVIFDIRGLHQLYTAWYGCHHGDSTRPTFIDDN